jgi:transmembrane sensor
MIDDRACQWAARIDRGLDDVERVALSAWLAEDGRHRGALLRAQAALSLLDRGRALGAAEKEPEAIESHDRRRLLRVGVAGIAAAVAGGFGLRHWLRGAPISTAVGEIRRLPLDDGSFAVVNSTSHIRVAFTPERRDIELSRGEAWFEVAHNKARPFTVSAGPVRVQAVGTAFDVRRRDGASEVMVTEGTVKVWSTASDAGPTLVTVGQRAIVREAGDVMVSGLAPNLSDQRLAWREGRIVLDNMTLAQAAEEFNRYHVRTLEIDPALGNRQVVGWFHTDDLDGFTQAAAVMVGGRVVRDGDKVRIVP